MKHKNEPDDTSSLEAHIDDMLDPRRPDDRSTPPPIDIFSDPATAPEVPEALAQQMKVAEPARPGPAAGQAAPPVTIDTADKSGDDPATDKAVDDIIKEEGDALLAETDDKPPPVAPKHQGRFRRLAAAWWHNRRARYGSAAGLALIIAAAMLVAPVRAAVLNFAGVRASAALTVVDASTNLPLKNVKVTLGAAAGTTDRAGHVSLSAVRLARQTLQIEKVAFGTLTRPETIRPGANNLGSVSLKPTGDQYRISLVDYVSGKPVTQAEATSGAASAIADRNGRITLTVPGSPADHLSVNLTAAGYRSQTVQLPTGSAAPLTVPLVVAQKEVFISKASGTYDVYKMDLDGQNRQLVLAGTGLETANMQLLMHATDPEAALVSSRDNIRDSDGYLLQALTLINIATNTPLVIDHSERIQLVNWLGNKLVYVRIKAGASAGNAEREQLMSYDYRTAARTELAHANNFNDVLTARGAVYYAASNNFGGGSSLFGKVNPDGSGAQTLIAADTYNAFRNDAASLTVQASDGWYGYKLGSASAGKLPAQPSSATVNRLYVENAAGSASAWIDNRDGQGVLSLHDNAANKDTVLTSATGLTYPVRWLTSDLLLYRVASPKETADYVVSVSGGPPRKVTDLTNVPGAGLWYYY